MSALETFSQMGFSVALVQKHQDITAYLDTAWTVQIIRCSLISLILFATASSVAAFFDTPTATPILQVCGISVLIQGFTNIGVIYFDLHLWGWRRL